MRIEPSGEHADPSTLSEADQAILALEGKFWRYQGTKESAIRSQLGLSPNRYYQRLNWLIQREDATAHAPILVGRLRRYLGDRQ